MPAQDPNKPPSPVEARFVPSPEIEGDWEVGSLTAHERFDHPTKMIIELRSEDPLAEAKAMLGTSATVVLIRTELEHEFSGIIERVEDGGRTRTELGSIVISSIVTLVPALVALRHSTNSRIFQELTVVEILEQVLEAGLGAYERSADFNNLTGTYAPLEYTVQYQESDYEFVHRLMEEHGISYYFVNDDGVEVMTLTDGDGSYAPLISLGNLDGELPIVVRAPGPSMQEDVHEFTRVSKLRSTTAKTMVFDWLNPGAIYETEQSTDDDDVDNGATLEPMREDYRHDEPAIQAGYRTDGLDSSVVDQDVAVRRAVHHRDAVRYRGSSTVTGLAPGATFELIVTQQREFGEQVGLDEEHVVISVEHRFDASGYHNRFECVPASVAWRPERTRRHPRIASIQTALVVGPAGEEIHTDEHGRIKVQFHWDRSQRLDDTASCWIRVVQPWAGNGWGFVFLPRIGMEVAVTFLDGDPDRPMVMGTIYNGANPPPYGLPDDKTKSTIKTASSPGGEGFNELRFEDAAGSEEIYIHAQKDFNEEVLNDHNTTVGNNQTNNVDVDQTQTVHGNQSETVDGDQEMTVGGNRTVHVVGDFEETVDATETRTVTGAVTETFAASETRSVTGDQTETYAASVTRTITGDLTDTVSGSQTEIITGGITTTTPANYNMTAVGGINMTTSGAMLVTATGGFTVLAPGGTKTVDQDFWKVGGGQGDAFSWQIGICAAKLDLVELAVGVTSTKIEATGIVIGTTGFHCTKEGTEIKTAGDAIALGVAGLFTFGIMSIA